MGRLKKWFQRRILDVISVEGGCHSACVLLTSAVACVLVVFLLGFWLACYQAGIDIPNSASTHVFADNIAGKFFLPELASSVLPIDVVYTWVNGSDPLLVSGLQSVLRNITGHCSPPHYCTAARYLALPVLTPTNSDTMSAMLRITPRLAGTRQVRAKFDGAEKDFLVARIMSEDPNAALKDDGLEQFEGGGNEEQAASDMDAVLGDVQQRMKEIGVEVAPNLAVWSTEGSHGWSVAQDTAAFVISSAPDDDISVLYHKLTRSIPQFAESCDRTLVPGGFFVECTDKLLIDDLRESVLLYNTPQTEDNMARVEASLRNNVPKLAKRRRTGRPVSKTTSPSHVVGLKFRDAATGAPVLQTTEARGVSRRHLMMVAGDNQRTKYDSMKLNDLNNKEDVFGYMRDGAGKTGANFDEIRNEKSEMLENFNGNFVKNDSSDFLGRHELADFPNENQGSSRNLLVLGGRFRQRKMETQSVEQREHIPEEDVKATDTRLNFRVGGDVVDAKKKSANLQSAHLSDVVAAPHGDTGTKEDFK